MNVTFLQFFAMLTGLFFCYHVYGQKKRGILSTKEAIFWLCIWGGLVIVSAGAGTVFPLDLTLIGGYRLGDVIMIVSIIALFAVSYVLYARMAAQNKKIKELIKKIAFDDKKA
ncbi:MAG: DUF2304 domain-containing protein [Candidatus Micrarchaeota archaeon]